MVGWGPKVEGGNAPPPSDQVLACACSKSHRFIVMYYVKLPVTVTQYSFVVYHLSVVTLKSKMTIFFFLNLYCLVRLTFYDVTIAKRILFVLSVTYCDNPIQIIVRFLFECYVTMLRNCNLTVGMHPTFVFFEFE